VRPQAATAAAGTPAAGTRTAVLVPSWSVGTALVRLGHPNVAVYDGGLVEWCADRSLPLQTGP
jgi:hypothetical protein